MPIAAAAVSANPFQDLAGRWFVITGANAGIGLATARALAARGAHLILACRSAAKTEPVVAELRKLAGHEHVDFVACDLGSLEAVREAGMAIAARPHPLHVLICNAGVGGTHGVTADGFEVAFGTNHLGHFLLTQLLIDKLRAAAPARVVVVSSRGHYDAKRPDWERLRAKTRSFTGLSEYAVSKLANVLFAAELGRREAKHGVTSYSLHPGFIASEIWGATRIPGPLQPLAKRFMRSIEDGCVASVRCATDPALATETGRYYTSNGQPKKPSKLARDKALAAELWRRSEDWVARDWVGTVLHR